MSRTRNSNSKSKDFEKTNPKGGKSKYYNKKKSNKADKVTSSADLDGTGRDNDPNYYFVSPEVAKQASELSFQSILGHDTLYGYEVPTMCIIEDVMNPGVTENIREATTNYAIVSTTTTTNLTQRVPGKAGVNVMAAKLYTLMSAFSGRTQAYAPQDVAIMILAIAAIAEFSEHIRRFFGLLLTYNFRNRMVPLSLIRALGCDPDDLKANISDYRMRFNVAMSRINQIPLLDNIAFIRKCRERYQRVYMDDPTNMSQLFAYVPAYWYSLDESGDSDGSILFAQRVRPANQSDELTMGDLLDHLEYMITCVMEATSLNLIYTDLENMANKISVPTWKFDYLAENYVVMPEFNANALLQFHNLTIAGFPGENLGSGWDIAKHQYTDAFGNKTWISGGASIFCDADKNNVVYNPVFSASKQLVRYFVDMPTDNPSIEDRIEALRNVSLFSGSSIANSDIGITAAGQKATLVALPDHYVAKIWVYGNDSKRSTATYMESSVYDSQANWPMSQFTQFEHFPGFVSQGSNGTYSYLRGGLQFYTEIDFKYIQRLLNCMTIGLFDFRV